MRARLGSGIDHWIEIAVREPTVRLSSYLSRPYSPLDLSLTRPADGLCRHSVQFRVGGYKEMRLPLIRWLLVLPFSSAT